MIATVASVNSAQRIRQKVGSVSSVRIKIIQTPASLSKDGCGYSLRFDDSHKHLIVAAASDARINIRAFYREVTTPEGIDYIKE